MKARLPQNYNKGVGNVNAMIKQAQKMQEEMGRIQEELAETDYTVKVGGGAVELVMTGKKQVKSLTIQPEAVDPEDVEMLQDMVVAAVNEALRSASEAANSRMNAIMGGMKIPGLM